MPPWILVTPSSRGLGLALARRLLRTTQLPVVATARGSLEETREAILKAEDGREGVLGTEGNEGRLHVLKVDFADEQSISDAASKCQSLFPPPSKSKAPPQNDPSHLHLAFVLPGILFPEKSPLQIDLQNITSTFQINTISHLLMLKHYSNFLPRKSATFNPTTPSGNDTPNWTQNLPSNHATWATMSARVGSITDNSLGGWYSYRASKAAVNQITKTFDNYLKSTAGDRAIAVSLHPGTVKTGLSKEFWGNVREGKLFEPDYSAERLCEVLKRMKMEGRGKCWDWEGKEILP